MDLLSQTVNLLRTHGQLYGRLEFAAPWGFRLRALADPQMAGALRLMHTEPGHPWTVPELARAVSMFRSAFAARFKALVGRTPLDHVTEWRMVRAAGMMREGRHLKLAAVAAAVGYESESAFGTVGRMPERCCWVTPWAAVT